MVGRKGLEPSHLSALEPKCNAGMYDKHILSLKFLFLSKPKIADTVFKKNVNGLKLKESMSFNPLKLIELVGRKRLELSRVAPLVPKTSVSTKFHQRPNNFFLL